MSEFKPKLSPYRDFYGREICEHDELAHRTGEAGIVVFLSEFENPADQWRVIYFDDWKLSRLCLQVGDKGCAFVRNRLDAGFLQGPRLAERRGSMS